MCETQVKNESRRYTAVSEGLIRARSFTEVKREGAVRHAHSGGQVRAQAGSGASADTDSRTRAGV